MPTVSSLITARLLLFKLVFTIFEPIRKHFVPYNRTRILTKKHANFPSSQLLDILKLKFNTSIPPVSIRSMETTIAVISVEDTKKKPCLYYDVNESCSSCEPGKHVFLFAVDAF